MTKIICPNLARCFLDMIGITLPLSAGPGNINVSKTSTAHGPQLLPLVFEDANMLSFGM